MNQLISSRLLCLSFVLLVLLCGCDSSKKSAEIQREIGTVSLNIDFGADKKADSIDVVCSPESTVLSILERAQNMNRLKVRFRGSGETAFVTSIGGIENEGADGQNWIFKVNDQLGDKSAGVFEVNPGDTIYWTFGNPPAELK